MHIYFKMGRIYCFAYGEPLPCKGILSTPGWWPPPPPSCPKTHQGQEAGLHLGRFIAPFESLIREFQLLFHFVLD